MSFTPERAAIRFGCGLSPRHAAPASVDDILGTLSGPDRISAAVPIEGMEPVFGIFLRHRDARRAFRASETEEQKKAAEEAIRKERREMRVRAAEWMGRAIFRRVQTQDGFRERLVSFWADHFSVTGKGFLFRSAQANYMEEAIRPHVTGRFADLLKATATHPMMIDYLDQGASIGPNSRIGKRNDKRGLNENLAREMLELHTLGVNGPYTQTDVRQLAELLTGVGFNYQIGFVYNERAAEPGPHTLLGRRYGGKDRLQAIYDAFEDLSVHPSTARYVSSKLAVHFVGDAPDPDLVDALETRYTQTGGDLMALYETLLTHPSSWVPEAGNVKQPIDFVASSLRALDLQERQMPVKDLRKMRRFFFNPMILMGQKWGEAPGPDGWPEADEDWITPQRLAARLQWAMSAPWNLRRTLPDPREFVDTALGGLAPEQVRFAASAAESRPEGVGVILSSAAFQRM